MKRIIVKSACILFLILPAMGVLHTGEDTSFTWEGTITVRQKKLPGRGSPAAGEVITEWQLKVNWKETIKNDIKDRRGNLVGQLVKLEDNGSTWTGITSGRFTDSSGEKVYSGAGEGAGPAMSAAWIYFSLSDDDPLSGVLPNGSYAIGSGSGQTQKYAEDIEVITYDPPSSHSMKSQAMLGYYISKAYVFLMPFGHIGGGPSMPGPTSAEGIRMTIENSEKIVTQSLPVQWDTEKRALQDGRMVGSFSGTWLNDTLVNEVEWDIAKVLDLQGSIRKPDRLWRPKGGDEKNRLKITASIDNQPELSGKWRFTLFEVSSERGDAMNRGDDTGLDFCFAAGQADFPAPEEANDGWVIESTRSTAEMTVEVESLDYGAWGKLKAEVNVEGNWYVCRSSDDLEYVTIPLDDDGDRIADMWEDHFDVNGDIESSDNDDQPEAKQQGDGFSNYEEYRGFFVDGRWKEWYFSPKRKDIFIYDEIGMGVANFTETGLMIHLIDSDEFADNRVVNFNRGHGTITSQDGQKGLILRQEALTGLWGEVRPTVGTPNVVEEVVICSISAAAIRAYAEKGIDGQFLANYAQTIAHELGHAVNIMHHGDEMWEVDRDYDIARRGGIWSGDISCIMRYNPPSRYLGPDGNLYAYPAAEEGSRRLSIYCSSSVGTGINAPGERTGPNGNPYPVAADAERGNCRNNITLKGYNREGK